MYNLDVKNMFELLNFYKLMNCLCAILKLFLEKHILDEGGSK